MNNKKLNGPPFLTNREVEIINKHRKLKQEAEIRDKIKLEYLKTAYDFSNWLIENKMEPSYSVFMHEFSYTGKSYIDSDRVYENVKYIIETAKTLSTK